MGINKVLQLIFISLLIGYISLPLNLLAENSPAITPETLTGSFSPQNLPSVTIPAPQKQSSKDKAEEITTPEQSAKKLAENETSEGTNASIIGLTVSHRVNHEKPLDETRIEPDLWVFLQTLKNEMTAQFAHHATPLQIETTVQPLLAENSVATVDSLPSLIIKTQFEQSGNGKSDFTLPPVQHKIALEEQSEVVVDLRGLQGQFQLAPQFKKWILSMDIAGLLLEDKEGANLVLNKATVGGEFDADLILTKMNLVIPSLKINHANIQLNFQEVTFDTGVEKSIQGVDLRTIKLKISQALFGEDRHQATLNHFELIGNGKVQEEGIFYGINLTLNQLLLPKGTIFDGEDMSLNYSGNIELRRVDVATIIELQKTARELQKQRQNGAISKEIMNFAMLGKLMDVAPKLLEKSPEISLDKMNIKTNHGELQGKLTISINGEIPLSFEESDGFLAALQAQAEFSIHKGLIEKILSEQVYKELLGQQVGDKKPTELADFEKQAMTTSQQRLESYIQQKLLLDIGNNTYKVVAQLQDGELTMNGQEVPLPF